MEDLSEHTLKNASNETFQKKLARIKGTSGTRLGPVRLTQLISLRISGIQVYSSSKKTLDSLVSIHSVNELRLSKVD